MRSLLIMLAVGSFMTACTTSKHNASMNSDSSTTTGKQSAEGWQDLFDGKTTNGWHTYGKSTAGSAWKVADGSLYMDNSSNDGRGDIVTDEEFDNFHLQLDWKISPKGNSGIIFYVKEQLPEYSQTWYTGPEMQVLDNSGHNDGTIYKHRAGDLYDLIASSKETAKPVGEWNHVEIIANKGKLDFFLNGVNIVSTTLWNETWATLIASSKFKDSAGFGKFRKGRIALQDHGDKVWYRNIKIKRL